MNFDEILTTRRSIRVYCEKPVEHEKIKAICEAALFAPSACNSRTWRFVVVDDRETIVRIAHDAMRPVISNRWLETAPVVIVGCSKLDVIANRIGKAITGIEYYQIDLGIAMEHMVLKATELGLGTCWIGWFHERRLKSILSIPRGIRVSALLAVGYPEFPLPEPRPRKSFIEIFHHNKWGNPFGIDILPEI